MSEKEIYSSRELNVPADLAYEAFANPAHLQRWWGPEGFTNTFHEFDLRTGGRWRLTMHGPEKGNYENASIFIKVIPDKLVSWTRTSPPLFDMEVIFEQLAGSRSRISFKMIFKTEEECTKMKDFVAPKNEENFDRLERELASILKNKQNP